MRANAATAGHGAPAALVVGALGVVFGDIGTSPIYTVQTIFNPADPHPVPISVDSVFGIASLIFWSVMIIVTITAAIIVVLFAVQRLGTAAVGRLATWRKRLFLATSHITADAAEYFRLPRDRTVIMGSHIEV